MNTYLFLLGFFGGTVLDVFSPYSSFLQMRRAEKFVSTIHGFLSAPQIALLHKKLRKFQSARPISNQNKALRR
jgi:hypothetical protein